MYGGQGQGRQVILVAGEWRAQERRIWDSLHNEGHCYLQHQAMQMRFSAAETGIQHNLHAKLPKRSGLEDVSGQGTSLW